MPFNSGNAEFRTTTSGRVCRTLSTRARPSATRPTTVHSEARSFSSASAINACDSATTTRGLYGMLVLAQRAAIRVPMPRVCVPISHSHAAAPTATLSVAMDQFSDVRSPDDDLLQRARSEYLEMPGLRLTLEQAQ